MHASGCPSVSFSFLLFKTLVPFSGNQDRHKEHPCPRRRPCMGRGGARAGVDGVHGGKQVCHGWMAPHLPATNGVVGRPWAGWGEPAVGPLATVGDEQIGAGASYGRGCQSLGCSTVRSSSMWVSYAQARGAGGETKQHESATASAPPPTHSVVPPPSALRPGTWSSATTTAPTRRTLTR
jgi:hypothetical protein